MNQRNYAKELSRLIEKSKVLPSPYKSGKPTLLLHSCCGPCSSGVLDYVVPHFAVTLLWYNPNLYPREEFTKRLETQKELLHKMGLRDTVPVLETEWRSEEYYAAVRGFEQEPEGGARCARCFRLRLAECAKKARELEFDFFGTTLTVSRHKNAILINSIGESLEKKPGALWLPSDFKKNDGENRSVELSEQYGIYRQNYCGCEFSLENRNNGKKGTEEQTCINIS